MDCTHVLLHPMPYDWTSPAHSLPPAFDEPPPSFRPEPHRPALSTTLAQIAAAVMIPFLGLGATRLVTTDTATSAPVQSAPPPALAEAFPPTPRLADPFASRSSARPAGELTKTALPVRAAPNDTAVLRRKNLERARTRR